MRSLKDKVERFLRRNDNQDDIRHIASAAKDVAEAADRLYREHQANGEIAPLLRKICLAAENVSKTFSRMHIKSVWVLDIRESMKTIEKIISAEKKELV